MFKRILVAIDGSPTSTHALRTALGLAGEGGVPLHVLHVIDDAAIAQTFDGTAYVSPQYVDSLLAGMREAGRKVLAKAQKAAGKDDRAIETALVETRGRSVAHAILAYARKIHPDLLVLGTHGRRGLSRLVMGSDAEMVVRESTVPVLLVRAGMPSARKSRSTPARESATERPARRKVPCGFEAASRACAARRGNGFALISPAATFRVVPRLTSITPEWRRRVSGSVHERSPSAVPRDSTHRIRARDRARRVGGRAFHCARSRSCAVLPLRGRGGNK